jgi:predicted DNA-binding ribbon-helix-helix protein
MRSTVKRGKSSISKYSIFIAGRKTTVSLEDEFWHGLKESAVARNIRLHTLVTEIDSTRQHANLSSAIRLFVLEFYQSQITLSAKQRPNRFDQGDTFAEAASFLCRDEDEVLQKARIGFLCRDEDEMRQKARMLGLIEHPSTRVGLRLVQKE